MNIATFGTMISGLFFCGSCWMIINIGVLLGPRVRKFPCVPSWFQLVLAYLAFSQAARGLSLLSSINTPAARIVHWDVVNGSFSTFIAWGSIAFLLHTIRLPQSLIRIFHRQYMAAENAIKNAPPGQDKALLAAAAMSAISIQPETEYLEPGMVKRFFARYGQRAETT